jgi:hypothetical protein
MKKKFQVMYVQKLKIFAVYFGMIVSVCICYENAIMSAGNQLTPDSAAVEIMYALQALQIPLLLLTLYETAYALYDEKGANMAVVQVEEQAPAQCTIAIACLWLIRLLAVCLLVLNILTNYQLIDGIDYMNTGNGGYIYLAQHPHSAAIWIALIPPIVLSIVALSTSVMVAR